MSTGVRGPKLGKFPALERAAGKHLTICPEGCHHCCYLMLGTNLPSFPEGCCTCISPEQLRLHSSLERLTCNEAASAFCSENEPQCRNETMKHILLKPLVSCPTFKLDDALQQLLQGPSQHGLQQESPLPRCAQGPSLSQSVITSDWEAP